MKSLTTPTSSNLVVSRAAANACLTGRAPDLNLVLCRWLKRLVVLPAAVSSPACQR
jgi:hypothetical protein